MHVGEVENLDPLPTPHGHAHLGRLLLGKSRLFGNDRRRAAESGAERGADVAAVQAGDVGLCQHLCPHSAEAASLVGGLTCRVGLEAGRLAKGDEGVWEVRGDQSGGHLGNGEGGGTFGAVVG